MYKGNMPGEHNKRGSIFKLHLTKEEHSEFMRHRHTNTQDAFVAWCNTKFNLQSGRTYHLYVDGMPSTEYITANRVMQRSDLAA